MTGLLSVTLERAHRFLVAPAPDSRETGSTTVPVAVGVVGLCRSSGASTVARGLAGALEARVPGASEYVRNLDPKELGQVHVDVTVLVAPGNGEPPLASIAARLLRARVGPVLVVANRVRDPRRWSGHASLCLPDSRLAAMIAARGHRPPGELGAGLVRVAAAVGEAAAASLQPARSA
jgi:hypothetical protein